MVLTGLVWTVSRSAGGRATLPHALQDGTASLTLCNRDVREWSRTFVPDQVAREYFQEACCLNCRAVVATREIAGSRAA